MSEKYKHRLRESESDFDEGAWNRMEELLDTRQKKKRWRGWGFYSRIGLAALVLVVLTFYMLRNKGTSELNQRQRKEEVANDKNRDSVLLPEKGTLPAIVKSGVKNKSKVQKDSISLESSRGIYLPIKRDSKNTKLTFNRPGVDPKSINDIQTNALEHEQFRITTDTILDEIQLGSKEKFLSLITELEGLEDLWTIANSDTVYLSPKNIIVADDRKRKKLDWFLTVGFANDFGKQSEGKSGLLGGGLNLSNNASVFVDMTREFGKIGYRQFFGQKRLKIGLEGSYYLRSGSDGVSLGIGAYYDLSENNRLFTKLNNYGLLGKQKTSDIALGVHFIIGEGGERIRKGPKVNFRNFKDPEWKWFVKGYVEADYFFGFPALAGFTIGRYLSQKSFVELGSRVLLKGLNDQTDFIERKPLSLEVNYNFLSGRRKLQALFRAGGLLDFDGSNHVNIGLGVLYKHESNVRLFMVPSYNRAMTLKKLDDHFSVQLGAQIRL